MHVAAKIAIGAGLIGAGALALAACGTKAPEDPKLADDDVMGAADRATDTDAMMHLAYGMSTTSGRSAVDAVRLLRAADDATDTDSMMLNALRMGLDSRAPADQFAAISAAADRATDTDSSLLGLLAMNASSRFSPQEYVQVLDSADRASDTDAALMSLVSIGDRSNAPTDQVLRAFADADRATDTDSAAISVVYDALRAYEQSYPTPGEIPGSGNYPTGGTSGGDDAAGGIYLEGHAPVGGDPAADAAR